MQSGRGNQSASADRAAQFLHQPFSNPLASPPCALQGGLIMHASATLLLRFDERTTGPEPATIKEKGLTLSQSLRRDSELKSETATPTGLEPATSDVTGRRSKPTELRSRENVDSSRWRVAVNVTGFASREMHRRTCRKIGFWWELAGAAGTLMRCQGDYAMPENFAANKDEP